MIRLLPAFCLLFPAVLSPVQAGPALADPKAVARIEGGIVDCPGCRLQGANLMNTCVKTKDLHGANFDGANATLMCMSFANFKGASFRGTDLRRRQSFQRQAGWRRSHRRAAPISRPFSAPISPM